MNAPPLPNPIPVAQPLQALDSSDTTTSLPPPITGPQPFPIRFKSVRQGCWLVNYVPSNATNLAYDGTIRVEDRGSTRIASGDLYQRPVIKLPFPFPFPSSAPTTVMLNPPSPANGIPIQARTQYRYYVRVTKILDFLTFGNSFELGLQLWKYTAGPNNTATWLNESDVNAVMTWQSPPTNSGYPSVGDYLEGDVKNVAGTVVARLTMGWVSESYRKATLEIDTVNGADRPSDSGAGQSWATVSKNLGYDLTLDLSDTNVPEPSGEGWTDAEAHAAMLSHRAQTNLDTEWRYHMLAVKKLDSTPRGKMYDHGSTDSDKISREGVAIAAKYVFESAPDPTRGIPDWGAVKGKQFSTIKPAYFRAAVHELGHAFGIARHNTVNTGFMNTTDAIASAATAATPFPSNIIWDYADNDRNSLRHWNDMFVRPGGIVFGGAQDATPLITPNDDEIEDSELKLEVKAVLGQVPLGAPVRIDVRLTNTGEHAVLAPREVGLKSACMTGFVQDPAGRYRTFRPMVQCLDSVETGPLGPGESIYGSLTLLRGAEGALFPLSGVSEVILKARWDVGDGSAHGIATAKTTVFVTDARSASHAATAHRILTTPDAHVVLAIGGDHLQEGIEAIQQAVEDETLGPHYAAVEAKRLAQPFRERKSECTKARRLVEGKKQVVMSKREKGKLDRLFDRYGDGKGGKKSGNGS